MNSVTFHIRFAPEKKIHINIQNENNRFRMQNRHNKQLFTGEKKLTKEQKYTIDIIETIPILQSSQLKELYSRPIPPRLNGFFFFPQNI